MKTLSTFMNNKKLKVTFCMPLLPFSIILITIFILTHCQPGHYESGHRKIDAHGALIRMDTTKPVIYLVFTGHDLAEGFPVVQETLNNRNIKASFFLTGDFYRNPEFKDLINTIVSEGHYIGAHSDKHLLYCSWEDRDSLLVTKEEFERDLDENYNEMKNFGIAREDAPYYMPPYEWYNKSICDWTNAVGLTLVNFTPGTYSNQDWTYPELGERYYPSDELFRNIIDYEDKKGMNGFILLIHMGTDPRREDKLYNQLDSLLGILESRGYSFSRLKNRKITQGKE